MMMAPTEALTAERIAVEDDETGSRLLVVDDNGDRHEFRLTLDAMVQLEAAGRWLSPYLAEAEQARRAVAAGVSRDLAFNAEFLAFEAAVFGGEDDQARRDDELLSWADNLRKAAKENR